MCKRELNKQLKRICVFAHYDPHSIVDLYVIRYLESIKQVADTIIFVTVCSLNDEEKGKIKHLVDSIIIRENIGYDFCSWKDGIEYLNNLCVKEPYELILANDSCYGPLFSFVEMFNAMSHKFDYWGVADCTLLRPYLQSYFMVFSSTVLNSNQFKKFWEDVNPLNTKHEVVIKYEEGLTDVMRKGGFKYGVYMKMKKYENFLYSTKYKYLKIKGIFNKSSRDFDKTKFHAINPNYDLCITDKFIIGFQKIFRLILPFHSNVFLTSPKFLIVKKKCPLIKTMLFKNNPMGVDIQHVYELIKTNSDYNINIIKSHIDRINK